MTCRILVADDSTPIQKVIKIAFSKYAVEIFTAGSFAEALKEVEKHRPELVIADASLPGITTASDFSRLLGKAQGAAMIMLMGTYDSVREGDLRSAGLETILKKPFDAMELLDACERIIPGKLSGGMSASVSATPQSFPDLPPPPMSQGEPVENHPSFLSLSLDSPLDVPQVPQVPKLDEGKKGLPAFDPGLTPGIPNLAGIRTSSSKSPSAEDPLRQTTATQVSGDAYQLLQDAAEELLRRDLPGIIDRAVQKYCNEHFKSIARDVLTAELRRLADEKARYLVDQ